MTKIYEIIISLAEFFNQALLPIFLVFLVVNATRYFRNKAQIYKKILNIVNEIDADDLKELSNEKADIVKFKK